MKRRYANSVNKGINKFAQKRIVEDYFKGYICKVNVYKVIKPIIAKTDKEEIVLLDDNYEWYMLYPDGEKYVVTIMYDDKNNLIEAVVLKYDKENKNFYFALDKISVADNYLTLFVLPKN